MPLYPSTPDLILKYTLLPMTTGRVEKHDVSLRRFEVVTNLRTYRLEVSKDAPSHTRVQWMVAIATVANCELDICHQTIYEVRELAVVCRPGVEI